MASPEELILTIPETFQDITRYKVIGICFLRGINPPGTSSIKITLEGDNGIFNHSYFDQEAWTLIKQLNTVNLSTPGNSLNARVLKRINKDGIKLGNVLGDPE